MKYPTLLLLGVLLISVSSKLIFTDEFNTFDFIETSITSIKALSSGSVLC